MDKLPTHIKKSKIESERDHLKPSNRSVYSLYFLVFIICMVVLLVAGIFYQSDMTPVEYKVVLMTTLGLIGGLAFIYILSVKSRKIKDEDIDRKMNKDSKYTQSD